MKRTTALAATVLLSATVVSACGSSTSPSATPSTSSAVAAPLPSGWQHATAPKAKLALGVPGDWTVVTGASVASNPAMAQRVSQLLHVPVAQIPELFTQLDIMAFAPKLTHNFDANINVTLTPLAGQPSAATIRAGYEQLHATDVKIINVPTPLGNSIGVTYALGQVHAQGEEIYVQTTAGIAGVTVTTAAGSDPGALMTQILPTLHASN